MRIALATCAELPELHEDDQLLLEPLRARGVDPQPRVWDDDSIDWAAFDLVVIRDTWDYTSRRNEFVRWAHSVPRLANPAQVIEWNSDKRYLADLAHAGLPVIPTTWISDSSNELPEQGMHVFKPAVGAGSVDAARFAMHDEHEAALAREHAQRLLATGQTVMVQPYLAGIDSGGESGVIFVGGRFSHGIRKRAMLSEELRPEAGGLYMEEQITARDPSSAELDLAIRALAVVPGGARSLTYARVDVVPGGNGEPVIMELELTEPSLFMSTTPGSQERFADAIVETAARLSSSQR
jgi:hypothetical protein